LGRRGAISEKIFVHKSNADQYANSGAPEAAVDEQAAIRKIGIGASASIGCIYKMAYGSRVIFDKGFAVIVRE
jgi:hypothetical protein